jgi:signal transduction histidine kinase
MSRLPYRASLISAGTLVCLANAGGAALTLESGTALAGWQLTCLGVGIPAAILGLLIAWHQPRNPIAWLFLGASVGFGVDQLGLGLLANPGVAGAAQPSAYAALLAVPGPLTSVWVLLILLFPEGRFHRALWRRYAVVAVIASVAATLVQLLIAPHGYLPQQYGVTAPVWLAGPLSPGQVALPLARTLDLPGLLFPGLALLGLAGRYRSSNATVRQQIKWLLFGACVQVGIDVLFVPLSRIGIQEPAAVSLLVAPLPTVGAALAIFRYRLWELDRLVSKTLAFAILWLLATAASFGLAGLAGLAAGGVDRRLLAAVTLALLAAFALQPLRGRLEAGIRHLVYGPRPRGYAALGRLADAAPGSLPVRELAEMMAEVAKDAVGVPWTSIWLQMDIEGRSVLRRAADAPSVTGDPEPASGDVALELWGGDLAPAGLERLLPQPVGAVFPMEASGESVGFLACGKRDGGEFSADDDEVLTLVARQAAVLLRSGRLEVELTDRLQELRESRQRLVTAQDDERRRLERDLHDGVQQQLVALAAKLRQRSRAGKPPSDLDTLADEAEEAVFAMQDLARGIYPSVLVDQGLASAIGAQASLAPGSNPRRRPAFTS